MTLNGVMALILRYFTEFMYDVVVKSSRSLFISWWVSCFHCTENFHLSSRLSFVQSCASAACFPSGNQAAEARDWTKDTRLESLKPEENDVEFEISGRTCKLSDQIPRCVFRSLLHIACTIPITSVVSERSISCLKIVLDERLSNIAILSVHSYRDKALGSSS